MCGEAMCKMPFMSVHECSIFTEKVKISVSFILKICSNIVYSTASAIRTESQFS